MSIVPGEWSIRSVSVNAQCVTNEGFDRLIAARDLWRIEPAGISLHVQQTTGRSAILESQSQLFFAEYFTTGNRLTINLTRPHFSERISISATFAREPSVV